MATIGEWAKVYGTGNYADTSKRIGTAVEEAIAQSRATVDRRRDEEDRQRKIAMEDYGMEQLRLKEATGLVIPKMSEYDNIEAHFQDAANYLPDAYYKVSNDKSLSESDKARQKAEILAEVGYLKGAKTDITNRVLGYEKLLNSSQLSSYQPMNALDFSNTLLTKDNGLRLEGEGTSTYLKGKSIDGKEINVPVQEIKNLARVQGRVPPYDYAALMKTAKDANIYSGDNKDFVKSLENGFEDLKNGLGGNSGTVAGNNALKAYACDNMGFNTAEVDKLASELNFVDPNDESKTYANRLEYEMLTSFVNKGQSIFVDDRKQQLDNLYKEQQIKKAEQEIRDGNKPKEDPYSTLFVENEISTLAEFKGANGYEPVKFKNTVKAGDIYLENTSNATVGAPEITKEGIVTIKVKGIPKKYQMPDTVDPASPEADQYIESAADARKRDRTVRFNLNRKADYIKYMQARFLASQGQTKSATTDKTRQEAYRKILEEANKLFAPTE